MTNKEIVCAEERVKVKGDIKAIFSNDKPSIDALIRSTETTPLM
jgi:hypothetical protein